MRKTKSTEFDSKKIVKRKCKTTLIWNGKFFFVKRKFFWFNGLSFFLFSVFFTWQFSMHLSIFLSLFIFNSFLQHNSRLVKVNFRLRKKMSERCKLQKIEKFKREGEGERERMTELSSVWLQFLALSLRVKINSEKLLLFWKSKTQINKLDFGWLAWKLHWTWKEKTRKDEVMVDKQLALMKWPLARRTCSSNSLFLVKHETENVHEWRYLRLFEWTKCQVQNTKTCHVCHSIQWDKHAVKHSLSLSPSLPLPLFLPSSLHSLWIFFSLSHFLLLFSIFSSSNKQTAYDPNGKWEST